MSMVIWGSKQDRKRPCRQPLEHCPSNRQPKHWPRFGQRVWVACVGCKPAHGNVCCWCFWGFWGFWTFLARGFLAEGLLLNSELFPLSNW